MMRVQLDNHKQSNKEWIIELLMQLEDKMNIEVSKEEDGPNSSSVLFLSNLQQQLLFCIACLVS
jgi:hypothetical protein